MASLVPPINGAMTEDLDPGGPDYDVQLESLGQWQIAWRRFRRHRMAMIGSALFFGMVIVGVVGPLILKYNYYNIPVPDVHVNAGRRKRGMIGFQ